jgi:hypothetical protein
MPPLPTLILLARILTGALRDRLARARADGGISTLEVAIIVLGLMAVAGAVTAAIAAAVSNRTAQIK